MIGLDPKQEMRMVARDDDWNLTDADVGTLCQTVAKSSWRWRCIGLPGPNGEIIRLEYRKIGGLARTSRAALKRFIDALQAPRVGEAFVGPKALAGTGEAGEKVELSEADLREDREAEESELAAVAED